MCCVHVCYLIVCVKPGSSWFFSRSVMKIQFCLRSSRLRSWRRWRTDGKLPVSQQVKRPGGGRKLTPVITNAVPLSAGEELNRVVSEAFLHFFVRTVGHYSSYVKRDRNGGSAVFEKRSFYKAIDSKTTRHFVKKFIQTQMFDLFIQEVEQQQLGPQQGGRGHSRWQKA